MAVSSPAPAVVCPLDAVAQLAFAASSDAFLVFALTDGRIVAANPSAERLSGLTNADLLSCRISDLFTSSDGVLHPDGIESIRLFVTASGPIAVRGTIHRVPDQHLGLAVFRSESIVEDTLRASEQRFRELVEAASHGIQECDLTGTITYTSPAHARMMGCTPSDLIGRKIWEFKPRATDREALQRYFHRLVTEQPPPTPYIAENRTFDGRILLLQVDWTYKRDSAGRLIGFVSVITDITKQRQDEEALRESEKYFRDMANLAPAVLWVTDPEGVCTFISRGWYELTGQPEGSGLGIGWTNAIVPEDQERGKRTFLEANARREAFQIEYRIERTNGDCRWVIDSGRPRFGPDGEFLGFVGSVIDITDRIRAEQSLRESETRFRGAFESAAVGMALVSTEGRWLQVNPALVRIFGRTKEELLATDFQSLTHPEDLAADLELLQDTLAGRRDDYQLQKRYRHKNGSVIWAILSVALVRDTQAKPLYFVSQVLDITARIRAEAERAQLVAVLEAASDIIGMADPDGRVTYINPAGLAILGPINGRRHFEFHPPDQMDRLLREALPTAERDGVWRGELTVRGVDGRIIPVSQVIICHRCGPGGPVKFFSAVIRDITDLKQAQAAVIESEQRLRRLVDHLPAGAVYIEAGRAWMNPAAERITGFTREQLPTLEDWFALMAPDRPDEARERYEAERKIGFAKPWSISFCREDGTERLLELAVAVDGAVEVWLLRDVTETERTARLMRQAEQVAAVGGWEYDPARDAVFWTSETYRIHGIPDDRPAYSLAEALSFYPEESRARVQTAVLQCLQIGEPFDLEVPFISAQGQRLWVRSVGGAIRSGGRVICIYGAFQDITTRRLAEEQLRESEARFAAFMDNSPVPCWAVSADGVVEFCNPALARLIGKTADQILGRELTELHPPELAPRSSEADQRVLQSGHLTQEVVLGELADGTPIEWLVHKFLIPRMTRLDGSIGPAVGSVGIDMTDRLRAERLLRERERFVSAVIDGAPVGILVFDSTGLCRRYNPQAREILLIDGGHHPTLNEDWAVALKLPEWVSRAREGHVVEIHDQELEAPGRDSRPLDLTLFPVCAESGEVVAVVMFVRDMSERRRIERKLQDAQKLESLGVMAGGIAHDFNNLLTGILGNAELVRLGISPENHARIGENLEQIEQAAVRAADLCRQMLAYAGKGRFVVGPVDLNTVIRETIDLLKLSVPKQARLQLNLASTLPTIRGDATQIRQVIMNLVLNAAEALPASGGVVTVTTGAGPVDPADLARARLTALDAEGDLAWVEVRDTGHGMDEATLGRILDPFFTTKFTGRGLGLAAVAGIVRGHHGAMVIDSKLNQGTAFRILFPVAGVAVSNTTSTLTQGWRGHGAVLVADDEEAVRGVIGRMLESLGFEVILTTDGVQAIERLTADIRLALVDMTMPRLDGEQTAMTLWRQRPGLPVILMSGYSEEELGERFVDRGFAGFLQKPFRLAELITRVRAALNE